MPQTTVNTATKQNRMPTPVVAAQEKPCPTCGEMNPEDAQTCANCNGSLNPPADKVKKPRSFLRSAFFVVLLVAVVASLYVAFTNIRKNAESHVEDVAAPLTLDRSVEPGSILHIPLECGEVQIIVPKIPDGEESITMEVGSGSCTGTVRFDRAK